MKKSILTVAFSLVLTLVSFSQTVNEILKTAKQIDQYEMPTNIFSKKHLVLSMNYGKSKILESDFPNLKDKTIEKVTYVYSKSKNKAYQAKLNRQRFNVFQKQYPALFKNNLIGWEVIEQTERINKGSEKKLFHGFVVTYREVSAKTIKKEKEYLETVMSEGTLVPKEATSTVSESDASISEVGEFPFVSYDRHKTDWDDSIKTIMKNIPALVDSVSREGNMSTYWSFASPSPNDVITLYIKEVPLFPSYVSDSTVMKVLDRNKHWDNKLIVHDVTGSMSPYTAQVLLWHKLNFDEKEKQHFVFFNDGDMTPDAEKINGKVGGIYQVDNQKGIDEVMKVASRAMRNGYGGDCPENNLEATIKGLEKFPSAKNILMIADNYATPRDLFLTKNIKQPVKIILCGVYGMINTNYLNLARETGGSIHTIESDIDDLIKIKEGEIIEIDGKKYKLEKGKFISLRFL